MINGIDLLEFRPSEIAAAAVLSVAGENQTVDTEKALYRLDHRLGKERVAKCVELMKKSSSWSSLSAISGNGSNELIQSSLPQSPIGVIDVACIRYRSDETTVGSCLPRANARHHHISPKLTHWLSNFDNPRFNLNIGDCILWEGTDLRKIRTWHIWDSIRYKLPEVPWHSFVWHKLKVVRYAHFMWVACHGRLSTLHRLASFGLDILPHCLFCAGGLETLDHILVSCPYSSYILRNLATLVHVDITTEFASWLDLLHNWGNATNQLHRNLLLLLAQIFCYKIWKERNARLHDKESPSTKLLQPLRIWRNSLHRALVRVLCILGSGEILTEYRVGKLALYDVVTGRYKDIIFKGMPSIFQTVAHTGSLN
ncbi:hypothetical protein POM88_037411 [Heracleum sosnowskyi]|uniref:Reverse transcriptase zinc-binding domain-containing protein n=1 Tax=Heracleum sosnowskyi TaxID=360622 RepID=A0AAD8HQ42_9APIA|nr:hypothetical protein POM88_037411 [Heracleum sosnowskyi]